MRLQRDRCVETVVHTEDCRYLRTVRIADIRRVVEGEALRGRARGTLGRSMGDCDIGCRPGACGAAPLRQYRRKGGGTVAVGLLG